MPETETLDETQAALDGIATPAPEPDEAEAADDDEQPSEPEPEPEPPAGPSPEDMEKRFKSAEKAFRTYTARITTIFEEQANELTECPLCAGTVPGFVLIAAAGHADDEVKAATQTYLGVTQEADYVTDQAFATCDRCAGLGKVRTGSRVPQWLTLTCETCSGRGYLAPPGHAPQGNGAGHYEQIGATGQAVSPVQDDADAWGSPRLLPDGTENPNYGRMPQYKSGQWP